MREDLYELLKNGAEKYGVNVTPEQAEKLDRYRELLKEWNEKMNLTAITDDEGIIVKHFVDSLSIVPFVKEFGGKKLADVGTGAGFPGLVLRLCEPSLRLTLLDSLSKRVNWLSELAPALGAKDVRCVHGRAEELSSLPEWREQYDIVTSRAVADLRLLCELCLPFVKVGGVFLAMKAEDSNEEVDAAGRALSILGGRLLAAYRYTIPGTEVVRKVIRIEKIAPTPPRYPRRFSKIKKSPL
jgi:16S rRNA (guanine527-N7)-methyltransferase